MTAFRSPVELLAEHLGGFVTDDHSWDHDGKHLPNATTSLGEPLMRIRWRSKAHSRPRSFARKPSYVLAISGHVHVGRASMTVFHRQGAVADRDRRFFFFFAGEGEVVEGVQCRRPPG
jgi:hypothetical protein